MKSKTFKILVILLALTLAFPLFGCDFNIDATYKPYGDFMTLTFAYENGYITDADARIIYDRYEKRNTKVNLTLDDETALKIKKDWYNRVKIDGVTLSDVYIYEYYGVYNDFVVLNLASESEIKEIAVEMKMGDYTVYSCLEIMVWYPKDKDLALKGFYDLYPNEKFTASSINKVIIDRAPGSISPPWEHHVIENSDQNYIEKVVKFFNEVKFISVNYTYDGVGYDVVTILCGTREFKFSFSNRDEYSVNNRDYVATESFPIEQVPGGDYYYIESVLTPVFSTFDRETELDRSFLQNIKYQVMIEGPTLYPTYRLTKAARITVGEDSVLIITSKNTFYFGNDYCRVIGDNDFSSLIDGITDETCKLTVLSENGDTVAEFVLSKNVLYNAQEISDKLYRNTDKELRLPSGDVFLEVAPTEDFVLTLVEKVG